MTRLTNKQMEEIILSVREGNIVWAIKLVREYTGLSLKAAKEVVDKLMVAGKFPEEVSPLTVGLRELVLRKLTADTDLYLAIIDAIEGGKQ